MTENEREGATMPASSIPQVSHEWPPLPYNEWADTCPTLQLWMQIVGKIRLALTPPINHAWNVTFYPTIRGVTTSLMAHGRGLLQIDFDFVDHVLRVETDYGMQRAIALKPMSVAAFYKRVMETLEAVGTPVRIWPMPVEVSEP